MRATEFTNVLLEGYKEATVEFSQQADNATVADTLAKYRDLVNRNQVQGNERNIDYWRKQGWAAFKQFVDAKSLEKSKTQIKRKKVVGNSVTLKEDDNWLVVIPLDKEASCFHGKNSDWCTTKPNQTNFEDYFYNREVVLIYCLQKQTGGMWAIAGHEDLEQVEMFDQQDNTLTEAQFKQQTGLDPMALVDLALAKYGSQLSSVRTDYKTIKRNTERAIINANQRNAETEKNLTFLKDGFLTATYVHYLAHNGQDVDALPEVLKKSAVTNNPALIPSFKNLSERTLIDAVKAKSRALEHIKNPSHAVLAAALSNDPAAVKYAPELPLETLIQFPAAAAYYAVMHKTAIPEAEPSIAKDPKALIYYLRVKRAKWPEAEAAIKTSPMLITFYIRDCLNSNPWPEGQHALLDIFLSHPDETSAYYLYEYARITGETWPEIKKYLIEYPDIAAMYAVDIMDQRWPELEKILLNNAPTSKLGEAAVHYADEFKIEDYFDKYANQIPHGDLPVWYQELMRSAYDY